MKLWRNTFLFCLLAGIFSCTKEISPIPIFKNYPPLIDTIFPGEYLPLYPGSYWNYVRLNGDTFHSNVKLQYELNSYLYDSAGETRSTPQAYVPMWCHRFDNTFSPMYKYSTPFSSTGVNNYLYTFLDEELNKVWYREVSTAKFSQTIAKDIIVSVNGINYDSVLVTQSDGDGGAYTKIKDFYAKHIGRIWTIVIDYSQTPYDTTWNEMLINYQINN